MTEEELTARTARIAKELVEARNAKGLSLRALQSATGIDDSNLSRIERGVLMPQIDTLIRIASALGVKTLHLE